MRHTTTRHLQQPSVPLQVLAAALAVLGLAPVWAAGDHPLSLTLTQSLMFDNNVLRDDDNKRRDLVSDTGLQLSYNKSIGRQRYRASAEASMQRYKNLTEYDNNGYALNGGFSTEIGRNGLVSIGVSRNKSLVLFENQGLSRRKETTTGSNVGVDAQYGIGGWWAFTGNYNHGSTRYDLSEASNRNYNSLRAGLRYNFTDLMYLDGGFRKSRTRIPSATVFTQIPGETVGFFRTTTGETINRTDFDLQGAWQITGFSSLSGSVSWSDEKNTPDPFKNYKGLTWNVNWGFTPRGKLSYNLAFSRDNTDNSQTYIDAFSTGFLKLFEPTSDRLVAFSALQRSLITSIYGSVSWQVTGKVSASMSASVSKIDNETIIGSSDTAESSSSSYYRSLSFSARYVPVRNLLLNCGLSIYRRGETNRTLGFSGETANCSAGYSID